MLIASQQLDIDFSIYTIVYFDLMQYVYLLMRRVGENMIVDKINTN